MSISIEIDGRRVDVWNLDEVAKAITGLWDSAEYKARWQHLCEFYAEHPERTVYKRASGPDPITIGEAQVYCLEHGLDIPRGLATGREPEEVREYRARQERERLARELQVLHNCLPKPKTPKRRDPETQGDKATPYVTMAFEELGPEATPGEVIEHLKHYVGRPESPFIAVTRKNGQDSLAYKKTSREGEVNDAYLTRALVSSRLNRLRDKSRKGNP